MTEQIRERYRFFNNQPKEGDIKADVAIRERKDPALDTPPVPSITSCTHHKKGLFMALSMISISCVVIPSIAAIDDSGSEAQNPPVFVHNQGSEHDASDMLGARCIECHAFDRLFSHPVGVTPPSSMSVPANLPLVNGKMTCTTCHSTINPDHVTARSAAIGSLSSSNSGESLCFQCHDANGFSAIDMHTRATMQAHLIGPNTERSTRESAQSTLPEWLDSQSDSCMTCHDGAMASGSGTDSGMNRGLNILNPAPTEHPIGRYELTDPSDSDGPLKPASMLDSRIRLFNDHVGCNSCHSVYSPRSGLLVMSNENSGLCLGCHEY